MDFAGGNRVHHGRCSTTHHICQGNVQKHSSSNGKDYTGGKGAPDHDAQNQADVARHRRQQVEENSLGDGHTGIQQDDEISCRGSEWGLEMDACPRPNRKRHFIAIVWGLSLLGNQGPRCSSGVLSAGGDRPRLFESEAIVG